jgi:CBS domain-containing protein
MDRIQELRVDEVMTPAPVCLQAECTIAGAIAFLVREHYQAAPILDAAGQLVGLVTRTHLLGLLSTLLEGGHEHLTLGEVVARGIDDAIDRAPLRCSSGMRLKDASKLLVREHAPALLVVRDGRLVGILTLRDVVRAMAFGDEPVVADHLVHGQGHGHCFTADGLPEQPCGENELEEERFLLDQLVARRRKP